MFDNEYGVSPHISPELPTSHGKGIHTHTVLLVFLSAIVPVLIGCSPKP